VTSPITITLARESLDDGSVGHTVELFGRTILADSEADALAMADKLHVTFAAHTGAEVRIRSTIETRH